jgi:transcriptional regulator with XRE-family HTH domain
MSSTPDDLPARVGRRLRELREARGRTQEQVAEAAGYSGKYVSEMERGLRDLPLTTLERVMERGLGVPVETVFDATEQLRVEAAVMALPSQVLEVAEALARLPEPQRRRLLRVVRDLITLVAPEGPVTAA